MALKIIGHRGSGRTDNNPFAAGIPPQQTLLSFQRAIENGADGVEFDIYLSKDNVPVIIHRKGAAELAISELTAAQISRISLPDQQHIPTLEETLICLAEMNARFPDKKLIINAELKGPGVVEQTLAVINDVAARYPLDRNLIFFDSLEWEQLAELKALDPEARIMPALSTARLFNTARQPNAGGNYDQQVFRDLEDFIRDQKCCGIDVMTADIRPEMFELAERMGVGLFSYPQGPKPREDAAIIQNNIGLLDEFSRRSGREVILKVEDVEAARSILEDYKLGRPASVEKIEKMMGMHLT